MDTTPSHPHWFRRTSTGVALSYAALATGWAVVHRIIGDGYWLLALVNAFAVYLFVPLPIVALLVPLARRRAAWMALLAVALLFAALFAGELTPPPPSVYAGDDAPSLTVMTYNVLYTVDDPAPIAATLAQVEPDLIAFQELSHPRAQALAQIVGQRYPYRTPIAADRCYVQVAVWSRYPILDIEAVDPEVTCRVRSVVIDFHGQRVRVLNVHAWPFTSLDPESVAQSFAWREEQADWIRDRFGGQPEPLILLGDLNSAPMSEVYATLSASLQDAFTEAGWGFGHTFPARGGRWYNVPYPPRLVRIDHILHCDAWRAEAAWVAESDGASDHHPLVARLRMVSE